MLRNFIKTRSPSRNVRVIADLEHAVKLQADSKVGHSQLRSRLIVELSGDFFSSLHNLRALQYEFTLVDKSISDLPRTNNTHKHTQPKPFLTKNQSNIPLARQSRGISLSVVTIHSKNYQCNFFSTLVHLMGDPLLTKVISSICIPYSQGIQFASMDNLIVIPHSLHLPDQCGHASE